MQARWPLRSVCAWGAGLWLLAFLVSSLHALDLAPGLNTLAEPGHLMTRHYDAHAVDMLRGDGWLFPKDPDPAETDLLARPPGYPIFLWAVYSVAGHSFAAVQLIQNLLDAWTPVLVFLLAGRLLSFRIGAAAGILAAIAPHFAYYSNLLLPDALCVLPVIVGVLLLERGHWRRARDGVWLWILAGVSLGVSTWLRPNTLLLAPFLAAGLVAIQPRRAIAKRAALLALASCLTIAPITIRNYVVYHAFVPVSINMGIVLWEGIADAGGKEFGAEKTDNRVDRQEARLYRDRRYERSWAWPDGIRRDRARVRRSLAVIRDHPLWFLRAMLGRMAEMLDYAGAAPPLVGTGPAPAQSAGDGAATDDAALGVFTQWYGPGQLAGLEPRLSSRALLAPGRAMAWSAPLVRALQAVVDATLLASVLIGVAVVGLLAPRRAAFVGLVPLAYLVFMSPMHLEFRVTLPMHAFLFVFAGSAWALLAGVLATAISRRRW